MQTHMIVLVFKDLQDPTAKIRNLVIQTHAMVEVGVFHRPTEIMLVTVPMDSKEKIVMIRTLVTRIHVNMEGNARSIMVVLPVSVYILDTPAKCVQEIPVPTAIRMQSALIRGSVYAGQVS